MIMNARLGGDPIAPRKRNKEVPPEVEEIILKAMEQDPDDRYQTAAEMKADLDAPEKVTSDRAARTASAADDLANEVADGADDYYMRVGSGGCVWIDVFVLQSSVDEALS